MTSLGSMVRQLAGLVGTNDASPWERTFISSLVTRTENGKDTTMLTDNQVEKLTEVWEKHFA